MSDEISVKKDDEVIITNQLSIKVARNCISTNYNRLHENVKVGNHIFVNCGTVDLEVAENEGELYIVKLLKVERYIITVL